MNRARHQAHKSTVIALLLAVAAVGGQPALVRAEAFRVGGWIDSDRTDTCVTGAAGTTFRQEVFAFGPQPSGLAYVTFRLRFPANVQPLGRPQQSDQVTGTVFTSFTDGTEEWTFIVADCPAGWVPIFGLDCRILDTAPALMEIRTNGSLLRNCAFVLDGVVVEAQVRVNDPECDPLPSGRTVWGGLKALYR